MVITSDNLKVNVGLSLKFEAKSLKVIEYSRKDGTYWEYSEKAIELIREYKVCYHPGFSMTDHSCPFSRRGTQRSFGNLMEAEIVRTKIGIVHKCETHSLLEMTQATEIFPNGDSDAKVKEVRSWLNTKGVRDFEPVSLFCDQLKKVNVHFSVERLSTHR